MTDEGGAGQARFDEATARAGRMVLAFRDNYMHAYQAAVQELSGGRDVEDTMRSLAWMANESPKHHYDDAGARKVVGRFVDRVPRPAERPGAIEDIWRDSVAVVEGVKRNDPEGVQAILRNTASIEVMLGCLTELIGRLAKRAGDVATQEVIDEARNSGPPPVTG